MLYRYLMMLFPGIFCYTSPGYGQVNISGRVVDEATGVAISSASVYFNNTSIGFSTDETGKFHFTGLPILNTELVVSNVGYEILVFKFEAATANGKYFLCKLRVKEQQLREVLVLSDITKKRWLSIFKKNFLGVTEEADRSSMANLNEVYFTRGDNRQIFYAYCDTPLVIYNRLLGYTIYFQLLEFSFDEATGRTYFYGLTRYETMGDKKRWNRHRREAYTGSNLHFYKAMLKNQLTESGFTLHQVKNVKSGFLSNEMMMASPVTVAQIMSVDTANPKLYRILVDGKLMVQYNKDTPGKKYLQKKLMVTGSQPQGYRSFIISKKPFFLVDRNGIVVDPLSVEYSGFWTYEKAANLLPYDYVPE